MTTTQVVQHVPKLQTAHAGKTMEHDTADCDSSQTLHLQLLSKSPEGTSMTVQAARDPLQTVLQELCLHKHKIHLHHHWRCSGQALTFGLLMQM